MEWQELKQKAMLLKSTAESILNDSEAEPCIKANAQSILAHARLLCLELGLDAEEEI